MRRSWLVSGALLWAIGGCGDDDAADDGQGGRAGETQAGSGGDEAGSAADSGSGASSGRGGAGSGAAAEGGGGHSGQSGQSGSTSAGGSGGRISVPTSQAVTITFKAKIGGADFACGSSTTGQGLSGSRVTPRDFRAFVQDVALINANDEEIPVTLDIRAPWQSRVAALLDFENDTGACSGAGTTATNLVVTGTVAPGDYKGIAFSNGVPDYANHEDPSKLIDPLHETSLWDSGSGFRFIQIALDTLPQPLDPEDPDGGVTTLPDGAGAALRVASAGCADVLDADAGATRYECAHPNRNRVRLIPYTVGQNVIVADVAKAFGKLDLELPNTCVANEAGCNAPFQSLGIDVSTGAAATSQSFYRVE